MASFRSWALLLFVVLAVAYCTGKHPTALSPYSSPHQQEARSTRRHKRDNADYYDAGLTTGENGLQRDAGDFQGDDGDEDENEDATVTSASPILRSNAENRIARPGETVFFPCNIDNNSSAVVSWQHGDKKLFQASGTFVGKLDKESKIKLFTNFSIEIPSVSAEDVGNYTCELFGLGQVTHTLQLQKEPPTITGMLPANADRRVVEGSQLRITCNTAGRPKPSLSWSLSKDGGNSSMRLPHGFASFEQDSIVIQRVQREHAGKYMCMAVNGVGQPAMDSVVIQVVGKPRVHVHKALVNAAVGVTASISCTVHEEPRSTITWIKDNVQLVDSADVTIDEQYPTSTVRIPLVKEKDFGTYTCIANNQYGQHNRSAVLVEEPVLDELIYDGDTLTWSIQSHMPINEVQLEFRRIDSTTESGEWQKVLVKPERTREHHVHLVRYSVRNFPIGKYEAVSRASNNRGWSSPTHNITFDSVAVEEPNPESIQAAGVGGHVGGNGSGAAELKSTLTLLTTAVTFLLIRLI